MRRSWRWRGSARRELVVKEEYKMREKRGQITIFIIIGIVLLFSTALIIYIRSQIAAPAAEAEIPRVAEVPAELQPIKTYVEECALKTTKDGLKQILEKGGYLDTSQFSFNPVSSTEGNAVELFPNSRLLIPYWYYLRSENNCRDNCVFDSEAPPLCKAGRRCITTGQNSVEEQLQSYVKDHLKECATFTEFRNQGFEITELENMTVDATIRARDATILIKWPIQTRKEGSVQKIEEYLSIVPSRAKELYEMAYDILNYESTNCLLEAQELNQLSLHRGLERTDLPPTFAQTFGDTKQTVWVQQQVEDQVKRLTQSSLRTMNIFNTGSFNWPDAPKGNYQGTRQAIWDQTVFFPLKAPHEGSVNFFYYQWWKPYFEINPNQGGILAPSTIDVTGTGLTTQILGPLSPKTYEFYYMYSHPAIVEIRLPEERDRTKQELLRFAMEANIRSNKCLRPNATFVSFGSGSGLLCDPEFRTAENYTMTVTDELNNSKPVQDAKVLFSAGDSCLLGYTDENGQLTTNLPQTFGGLVNIKKEGYLGKIVGQQDISTDMQITMKPIIEIPFAAKSIDPGSLASIASSASNDQAYQLRSQLAANLTAEDTVIFEMKRINDNYMDEEFEQTLLFDKGKWLQQTVKLVPGTYDVKLQLFLNRNITLPEEHDIVCTPLKPPDFLEDIKVLEDLRKAITPGCIKTPIDKDCKPRGDSTEDYQNGDCFKQGYTCESINEAIKKNSGAVTESQRLACLTGGPYFGLIEIKTDAEWAQWLLPLDACSKKGCTIENVNLDIPGQSLSVIPLGGAELIEETGRWFISNYDEIDADKINFYLFRQDVPQRIWHLQRAQLFKNLSREYRYVVEPEAVR